MLIFFNEVEYKINNSSIEEKLFKTLLNKFNDEYIKFENYHDTYKLKAKIYDSKLVSIKTILWDSILKYTNVNDKEYELREDSKYDIGEGYVLFEYILDRISNEQENKNEQENNILGYYVFYKGERISKLFKDKLQAQTYIDDSAEYLDEITNEFEIATVLREE